MSTHDVVTVDTQMHLDVSLGSGDRLTNTLYDCTADGASLTITADETNWEIRHIAVVGHNDTTDPLFDLSDRADGRSVLENIWAGEGGDGPGIHVDRRHSGDLTIARARIESFADRGIASHAPITRGNGSTTYDRVYVAGCQKANIQTGDDTLDTVTVDPTSGEYRGRSLWARGDCTIANSNFGSSPGQYAIHAGTAGRRVTVDISDSQYDNSYDGGALIDGDSEVTSSNVLNDPELSVPDGVPLTEPSAYEGDEETIGAPGSRIELHEFDRIEIGHGEHRTITVADGESLTNTVFDLSNSRSSVTILTGGPDWELRNLVFDGVDSKPDVAPAYAIVASVPDGYTASIDNIYMGDGSTLGPGDTGSSLGYGRAAMYIRNDHAGELSVSRLSAANWPGGGIVANPSATGDIHVEDSYFRNLGYESLTMPTATSTADNCVFVNHREANK